MDATDRINEEFDRLLVLGTDRMLARPYGERIVWYVVCTRCEIDIDGFASVYEQALDAAELSVLIDGLRKLDERELADAFALGLELLQSDGFYKHLNWHNVSEDVKRQIAAIGKRVGSGLWGLDEKLVALLDANTDNRPSQ